MSPVEIREVWAHNLESEFALIQQLADSYSVASMDTEFPGVIYRHAHPSHRHHPRRHYRLLKSNVDALQLIQLGLTLADPAGLLPTLTFQFNFRDFDLLRGDPHSPDSVLLLSSHGLDFQALPRLGADSARFAQLLISSGLLLNDSALSWVTFHSAYDFAYLIKILTGQNLPDDIDQFLGLVGLFFGDRVYDVKHLMRFCGGLFGGLDRVAKALAVERVAGKSHQAGSDSLLTWHTFERMRERWFRDGEADKYAGVLYGLEPSFVCS